jgi:hypothetical protein
VAVRALREAYGCVALYILRKACLPEVFVSVSEATTIMIVRDKPTNLVAEPPYPYHPTVVFSIRHPEYTAHKKTSRCAIQRPHKISECGEWQPAK